MHIHECPECGDEFECDEDECFDATDGTYNLGKVCKGCEEDE